MIMAMVIVVCPAFQAIRAVLGLTALLQSSRAVSKLTSGWKYTPFDNDNNKDNQDNSHGDKTNKSRIS